MDWINKEFDPYSCEALCRNMYGSMHFFSLFGGAGNSSSSTKETVTEQNVTSGGQGSVATGTNSSSAVGGLSINIGATGAATTHSAGGAQNSGSGLPSAAGGEVTTTGNITNVSYTSSTDEGAVAGALALATSANSNLAAIAEQADQLESQATAAPAAQPASQNATAPAGISGISGSNILLVVGAVVLIFFVIREK